ncbi:hypothetical protein O3G_MSEX014220 [Manduca sexta]|uniref:Uncharacterized protein n=1 Tax=Manduca sexta TaxID=7130 RepID=A0A922D113_MANSE|nr:hypothetical protein O3G_MSEX014220 [Manduca sexta]
MAPGNNERHTGHTGTIPKTKARNNCNVPQEAVTPTRRDMTTNLVSTSLDWVPVSEYNSRTNYSQTRKLTNNTSDQELTDLDNSVSFESGFGRFVPVRPQPRALPLNGQSRDNIVSEQHEDGTGSTISGHSLHPYAHQMQNGLIPHSNHAAAAVMIVNPTTPNAVTGNVSQPFNASNQNRNNLSRNINSSRNNFDGNNHLSANNSTPPISNSRSGTKAINLMNNMYEQGQGSFNNLNDSNHVHRESARALGEAIVAACPDAAAVERRLGQIREYIRVTSSLVDTMRNSEDEDIVTRPVSVQSNGSAYSENELWQNEIKNKMELSQMRLAALKQQQKRLLKYQEEAKQQLEEIHRERQSQEVQPSTSHVNFSVMQNQAFSGNYHHANRMYAANQIGVATTLPHTAETLHGQQNMTNNVDNDHLHSTHSTHSQDERLSQRENNIASSEEAAGGGHSEAEDDEILLNERGQMLQMKLRELQMKKQHMENLVSEFQKLQMATRLPTTHNTYSTSGEESAEDEPRKCVKSGNNIKNEDPFKLMEIKAIKTALQKTKDLMRSVENYEAEHLPSGHETSYRDISGPSNIHDNKSEGGGSMSGWSNEGSMCRVRNTLPQRHKFTNEQQHRPQQHHSQQQQLQQHMQQQQLQQQQSHEANIASLQELAQELRMETEKIMGERARIKDMVSNKEVSRKQKKVNEEVLGGGGGGCPGPAERRQLQLRALLADKQRELDALLNKEVLCSGAEVQKTKPESRSASIVNQSYNSEHEEPEPRAEHTLLGSQSARETENFRASILYLGIYTYIICISWGPHLLLRWNLAVLKGKRGRIISC